MLLDKQDKRDLKSIIISLLILVFVVLITGSAFGVRAVLQISNDQKRIIEEKRLEAQAFEFYNRSIQHYTFVALAAEASTGLLKNLYKTHMNNIGDDKVLYWKYITGGQESDGLGWKVWQNVIRQNEYCLVFAGTDQLKDCAQYFSMVMDEETSSQMQKAVEVTKNFKNYIENTQVDKLYIVGHSLGGYIAAYIASGIIQYELGNWTSDCYINTNSIASDFNISKLQCFTFGAPGIYYSGTYPGVALTEWQKSKISLDKNHIFDAYITNYIVDKDPIGNLLNNYLGHLGKTKILTVDNITEAEKQEVGSSCGSIFSFNKILAFLTGKPDDVVATLFSLKDLAFHMPWIYAERLSSLT